MCGHVGIAGNILFKHEKAFRTLLVLDSIRGEHSTGIAAVTKSKEVRIAKAVGDPYQLFEQRPAEEIFKTHLRVLIGHNRYATTGKINRRNAHPFEFDNLVGAHNGTLTNKHILKDSGKFEVDSEALFNQISLEGVGKTIPQVKGAWALVWWDKDKEAINFLRNKERTLYYTFSKDEKTIFWASESWMLTVALSRHEIEHTKIESFKEDVFYSLHFDFLKDEFDKKIHTEKIEGAKEVDYSKKAPISGGYLGSQIKKSSLLTSDFDTQYLGADRTYRIISLQRDEDGAEFLELADVKDYEKIVRFYIHKDEFMRNKIGYQFKGKVTGARRAKAGYIFYKVSRESVLFLDKTNGAIINEQQPKDKKGNDISEADLKLHYSSCVWCTSPLDHSKEGNVYMDKESGAVCFDCATNPQVIPFIN